MRYRQLINKLGLGLPEQLGSTPFVQIKTACDAAGIDFYGSEGDAEEDIPPSLRLLRKITGCEEKPMKRPIDENVLTYYMPRLSKSLADIGISYLTQRHYGIGYDPISDNVAMPLRDETGALISVQALKRDGQVTLEGADLDQIIAGYWENRLAIEREEYVMICPDLVSMLQLHAAGYDNSICIPGPVPSDRQREILTMIGTDKELCFLYKSEFVPLGLDSGLGHKTITAYHNVNFTDFNPIFTPMEVVREEENGTDEFAG